MKKILIIIVILIASIIGSIIMLAISPMIIPTRIPLIRYGKFNYEMEYELNGERKTVSGKITCKYKGLARTGQYIPQWDIDVDADNYDDYLHSVLLGNSVTENGDMVLLRLQLPYSYEYFFKDLMNNSNEQTYFSDIPWIDVKSRNETFRIKNFDTEIYGFKLINWKCTKPRLNMYIPYSDPLFIILIILIVIFVKRKRKNNK